MLVQRTLLAWCSQMPCALVLAWRLRSGQLAGSWVRLREVSHAMLCPCLLGGFVVVMHLDVASVHWVRRNVY